MDSNDGQWKYCGVLIMGMIWLDSQTMTDIGDAIRLKNGENTLYLPSEMPSKITSLSNVNVHDIFNHGDVVGLNPYYWYYNGYRCDTSVSRSNTQWNFSFLALYRNLAFSTPVDLSMYKKWKITLSVSNAYDDYKDLLFGLRKKSRGFPGSEYSSAAPDLRFQVIGWNGHYNIAGHSPWYELPKQTLTFNIGQYLSTESQPMLEIYTHCSDVIIYSMWLET